MDELDSKILSVLIKDGRTSNVQIARLVNASEATIRRRIEAMIGNGIFKVVAVADAYKIGFNIQAIIHVSSDPNHRENVARELEKIDSIRFLVHTTGEFDFFIQAFFANNEELMTFLINELGSIQGIQKIQTDLALAYIKRTWDFQLTSPEIKKGNL